METIKSYTSLEQSKVLDKILPIESADMHYHYYIDFDELESIPTITEEDDHFILFPEDVRCWSLAALLNNIPQAKLDNIKQYNKKHWRCCAYFASDWHNSDWHDNPVDACYEMVLKLHEQKLL